MQKKNPYGKLGWTHVCLVNPPLLHTQLSEKQDHLSEQDHLSDCEIAKGENREIKQK
jgi:hypothetical protein